eukprot:TRINITY_DN33869_c0_g1_i1.p1 TRINITY_DN33869_c0_g1~~TRINITY_DN33869_c0_g1_i1.p1  ORF type:complete len:404 (+),score=29.89 TRINITY_DN33869_c0_g1_i1:143-1354(+)
MGDHRPAAGGGRVSANSFACGSNQNCGNVLTDRSTTRLHAPPGGKSSFSLGWSEEQQPAPRQRHPSNYGQQPEAWGPGGPSSGRGPASGPPQQGGYGRSGPSHSPRQAVPSGGRVSSNAFATGSNQNCGNVMTDVSSTRVNAPPGGASSMTLGWGDSAPSPRSGARGTQAERSYGSRAPPPQHFTYAPEGYQGPAAGYVSPRGSRVVAGRSSATASPPQSPQGGQRGQLAAQMGSPQRDSVIYGQRSRVSSNSFANGADQNCGNFLTGVPTTRVLRPPGGSSNINLSWDAKAEGAPREAFQQPERYSPPRQAHGRDVYDRNSDYGYGGPPSPQAWQASSSSQSAAAATGCGGRAQEVAFGARPRVSSNTYANGADQNCGNVISDTPSTRVLRPPGGASSLTLG